MAVRSATSSKTGFVRADQKSDSKAKAKSVPASRRTSSEEALEEQAAKTQAPTSVQPIEPEDAYLTGVSRSLQRRLLGLNVSQAKPIPGASSAGIHSTGSYTEGQGVKSEQAPKATKNGKKK
jgi:hypothetical protein